MSRSVPELSKRESLIFNVAHILPYYMRGIFTRNPFWFMLWSNFHPDPIGLRFIATLRQKYHSDYFYLSMLGTKTLLVLDRQGIRHVLDHSPSIYVDGKVKRVGMSHFQPHALTISRGDEWAERRDFNEAVLNTGHSIHTYADHFLAIIRQEIAAPQFADPLLTWNEFARLIERIALQILFGKGETSTQLTEDLTRMMRESNRIVGLRPSRYFDSFYQELRRLLTAPRAYSLASLSNATPSTERTSVESQLTHWIFAMKDTLAENVVPALALILSTPAVEARVRKEMAEADLTTPQGIDSLRYLEACVQEAMRLWPTTPLLTREVASADLLQDIPVAVGTQVLIHNSFTHRDENTHPQANRFCPEIWLDGQDTIMFNHLSNGPQACAGKELALFIAKSVLATMLSAHHYRLRQPRLDANRPVPQTFNPFLAQFEQPDHS